jgi:hypothetical protein
MDFVVGKYKQYRKSFWWMFGFTALLYAFYMINQLTNVGDGFWQQSYYMAGDYETSCGRWLWPYIDKLSFGLHVEPLTTLFSIAVFALAMVVVFIALDIDSKPVSVIGAVLALSSPIFSAVISYRFLAVVYALACFFACAGACACIKIENNVKAVLLGAVGIALSMGLYQAYLGVFCLVGIISLICLSTQESAGVKDIVTRIVRFILAVPVGGVLYFIVMKLHLLIRGVELTEYNGASSVSPLAILLSMPSSLVEVLTIFFKYLKGSLMITGALDGRFKVTLIYHIVVGGLFVGLAVLGVIRQEKDKAIRIAALILGLILIPVGTNFASVIAPGSEFMPQMGFSMAMLSGILPVIIVEKLVGTDFEKIKLGAGVLTAVCIVVIYGQSAQVLIDHSAMQQGYTATKTLANGLVSDFQRRGLLTCDKPFFFIGRPSDNKTFYVTEVYDKANEYARVGDFWLTGSNMSGTYRALFNRVMGVNITVLGDEYESKAYDEYYLTVPSYPDEGYILDWDTVIVKISEP